MLIVAMLLGILAPKLASPGQWAHRFKVGLGLDLSSGTQVTLQAQTQNGKAPSKEEMNAAISVIQSRVNGTGNSGAQVQPQGTNLLIVTVPGKGSQQTIQLVSSTALLMFRQVLLFEPYGAASTTTPSASPSASASASASPSASASGSVKASPSASPSANSTSTAKTSAKIVPAATSSPSPSASASGTASGTASPSASASPSPSASSTTFGNPSLVTAKSTMALFNKLVCKPGDTEKWKAQVGYDKNPVYDDPNQQVVACGQNSGVWGKYILDKAKVLGKQVTSATAALSTTSNQWQVNLTMNGAGASAFSKLTSHMYSTYYTAAQGGDQNAAYLDQIGITLDGNIVSAPEVQGAIPGGNTQITGSFTQQQATQLQDELKFGSLPLNFKTQFVTSVSAQVGRNQLDAGLIAAGIGLLLVVVYSFLYYRGLGIVSVSSLIIAALITYLAVVLLSLYQNFTLSLAGIAGLIVAIGITADSFVVYFERLRDEVREGKQLRPAVESGWKRARRTILVSDTVSFLAALLLYYFAIGDVKGFAYTLGLTTMIDVLVVFMFTKPMMTLLAGTKFFGNGHPMSGLDPARLGAKTPWRSSVRRNQSRRRPESAPRTTASRNPGGS
ncbi:MAG TPA: protein translocase subunit SecD [Streptosporangiaceae bacterium]|nr:protein translocase subunit SecD [Streptosporangiaceae bacterium]